MIHAQMNTAYMVMSSVSEMSYRLSLSAAARIECLYLLLSLLICFFPIVDVQFIHTILLFRRIANPDQTPV